MRRSGVIYEKGSAATQGKAENGRMKADEGG